MPLTLPKRPGEPPETGPSVPNVQFTQTSPGPVREELRTWMGTLPGTVTGPSGISDPSKVRDWLAKARPDLTLPDDIPDEQAFAVFLHDVPAATNALLLPPTLDSEFAHLHPDGSLHLALGTADRHELLDKGWGRLHPLYSDRINVVLVYAPRDTGELAITTSIIAASYEYATGLVLTVP